MKNINSFLVLSALLLSLRLPAQSTSTGSWLGYFGNQPMGKRFNFHNEIQYRNYGLTRDFNQFLVRTGIGYNLTENNNNVLAGYAFLITDTQEGAIDNEFAENRIWQQFLNRQTINRVIFVQRYRTEQRFFNGQFQLRFRFSADVTIPITHKKMDKNTLYARLFNEIFIKTDNHKFDRNRWYVGLGYVLNSTKRVELGFLNQTLEQSARNQVQLYFINNFRLF